VKRAECDIAALAEREAEAQLLIVRALGKLDHAGRQRVMTAVGHLIAAEQAVPGLLRRIQDGLRAGVSA
jgi:hypothetical protein